MDINDQEVTINYILENIENEVKLRNISNKTDILRFSDILFNLSATSNSINIQSQVISESAFCRLIRRTQRYLIRHNIYKFFTPFIKIIKKFMPNALKGHKVNTLLKYEDRYFIINAYKIILARDPDEEGLANNLKLLRDCKKEKIEILIALINSQEGRRKNVRIYGLKVRYFVYKFSKFVKKVPVIGYILTIIFGIIGLPATLNKLKKSNHELFTINRYEIEQLHDFICESSMQYKSALDNIEKSLVQQVSDAKEQIGKELVEVKRKYLDLLSDTTTQITNISNKVDVLSSQIKPDNDHSLDSLYVSFEDAFRGTRQDIKERLKVYLPYIENINCVECSLSIIDLGCGRGEWIELLKENGYTAKGVDLNRDMINVCRKINLNVEECDAVGFLKKQKSNSVDVITGFHIVEHFPLRIIVNLFDECLRVLKPNGKVIFETPNPENIIVGSCNFYTDLSHIKPIHPETLKFLLSARGFDRSEIIRLHPLDYFGINYEKNDPISIMAYRFNMEQDYSVVAVKV